jgi:PBSX family phage terminase large subunit
MRQTLPTKVLKLKARPEKPVFGQLGEKAYNFAYRHPSEDARITVLEGAIRSGKTWALHPKLLQLCDYDVEGVGLIIGVSQATIYTNMLHDFFNIIGPEAFKWNRASGELHLFGSWWRIMSGTDEGSEKYLRGATVGKAIIDEATKVPESFWKMLITRMSPPGARLYATTNPDSPYHYLKTDWMDNPDLREAGDIEILHFDLDDNPWLAPSTKVLYERAYKGVFYLRFIKGLWVVAEGAIYRDSWSPDLVFTTQFAPTEIRNWKDHQWAIQRYISVDYGTTNPCVFGEIIDDSVTLWQTREWYWDSEKEMKQMTDTEYGDAMDEFVGEPRNVTVIVDPSAASFKVELMRRGYVVVDAVNDVLDGIRKTASMFCLKRYRIHEDCVNSLREIPNYAWNEKKQKLSGAEEPIKLKDHCPDMARYGVATIVPDWRMAA